MMLDKIKYELENSSLSNLVLSESQRTPDWTTFTRTTFMNIAKCINNKVTQDVIRLPYLVEDNVLIGTMELDRIFYTHKLNSIKEFINFLDNIPKYRTFNWISGKTLQSYWLGETKPKERKINVLLTYLELDHSTWDRWKSTNTSVEPTENTSNELIKKYYLGSYCRYYRKIGSNSIVKVPFEIYLKNGATIGAKTKTIGHSYESKSIWLEEGALYCVMKNINFNEYKFFIFNIGLSTSPKLLMGLSSSLSNKKEAISKMNFLVKQNTSFDFDSTAEVELKSDMLPQMDRGTEDFEVIQYLNNKKSDNHISTFLVNSIEDLPEI